LKGIVENDAPTCSIPQNWTMAQFNDIETRIKEPTFGLCFFAAAEGI